MGDAMTGLTSDQTEAFKEFLRKNLVIEARNADPMGPGNSVYVELRFLDEKEPFSKDLLSIPDSE